MNKNNNSPLSPDANLQVSGLLHRGESKSICVMVEDRGRSLEVRLPDGDILHNDGYSAEESEEVLAYLTENMDDILQGARSVNPMKAFMS